MQGRSEKSCNIKALLNQTKCDYGKKKPGMKRFIFTPKIFSASLYQLLMRKNNNTKMFKCRCFLEVFAKELWQVLD
jgi:hypothetical protein